jgi:hypothetical protein
LRDGCREVTSELSWDRLTQQMEGYYKGVVAGSDGSY